MRKDVERDYVTKFGSFSSVGTVIFQSRQQWKGTAKKTKVYEADGDEESNQIQGNDQKKIAQTDFTGLIKILVKKSQSNATALRVRLLGFCARWRVKLATTKENHA